MQGLLTIKGEECDIVGIFQIKYLGGQAFGWFDRDMACLVTAENNYQIMDLVVSGILTGELKISNPNLDLEKDIENLSNIENISEKDYKNLKKRYMEIFNSLEENQKERITKVAWIKTRIETYQAMEGLVSNLNTMHSRAGRI